MPNELNTVQRKPLRLWPGVVLVVVQWLVRFVMPVIAPDTTIYAVMGGAAAGLLIVLWWLFFSRAPWSERLGGLAMILIALFAMRLLVHKSISTGAMGMLFYILAIPLVSLALVLWAVLSQKLSRGLRWATMAAAIFIACGSLAIIRTGGFTAGGDNEFAWRWSETPEDRLLAKGERSKSSVAQVGDEADWPGFRGRERDSVIRGIQIETNWSASPPKELWRRAVGPGWSSFAVSGKFFYTQEQRGENEVVSCYDIDTGEPVWMHNDRTRFWESNAGAGPRGTPTLNNGRVYTFGGTGILNALDASTGKLIWTRNVASDTKTPVPYWGFSSSPLVIDDVVIIAPAGNLAAYDIETGNPRWQLNEGGDGYSSPHEVTIGGVRQVVLLNEPGVVSVAPADGKVLWQYSLAKGTRMVQPAVTSDGDLLIAVGTKTGLRRISVTNGGGKWNIKEKWSSIGLKPYFNDFVVSDGHAYGFDGNMLSCIEMQNGKRKWKGGKYGNGQLIHLADQKILLIISEKGELALVKAAPEQFTEIAAPIPAIKGKTWNHPALVRNTLLVRNDREMAAFKLASGN